jgi:hypothetical protein
MVETLAPAPKRIEPPQPAELGSQPAEPTRRKPGRPPGPKPFDRKAYARSYMRDYMRKRRPVWGL